jgi:hypothetical protein
MPSTRCGFECTVQTRPLRSGRPVAAAELEGVGREGVQGSCFPAVLHPVTVALGHKRLIDERAEAGGDSASGQGVDESLDHRVDLVGHLKLVEVARADGNTELDS